MPRGLPRSPSSVDLEIIVITAIAEAGAPLTGRRGMSDAQRAALYNYASSRAAQVLAEWAATAAGQYAARKGAPLAVLKAIDREVRANIEKSITG